MNLREDIERIKEVMGINESRDMFFRRRQGEFLDDVLTSFEWIEVEEADSFEEYLEFILRHSIDGFFGHNNILLTSEEIDELLPFALQTLRDEERLFRKIRRHYYSSDDSSINESEDINESNVNFLKRRQKSFMSNLYSTLQMLPAFGYESLEEFVDQIVIETLDFMYREENMTRPDRYKDDPFFQILKQTLLNDEGLFYMVKTKFLNFNPYKSTRINESRELLIVKRRMDALLDYIEASYDWLSPRAFKEFDDFLERVVFSATRDFVVEEIGGEFEEQLKIRDELEPIVLEFIKKHSMYHEIYDHYISNI